MKIKISFVPDESPLVTCIIETMKRLLPAIRIHENDSDTQFRHIFLTTKMPQKSSNFNKKS